MTNTSGNSGHDRATGRSVESGVISRPAEAAFQKGLAALKSSDPTTARVFFEAAIDLQVKSGGPEIQPRYLSYYGLTLMDDPSKRVTSIKLCRKAVREEFFNPDLFLNLSRVCLHHGLRDEAYQAAMRGLALDPRHQALRRHLTELGRRRRPPLRFLSRSNFLNIAIGRLLTKERNLSPVRPPGNER